MSDGLITRRYNDGSGECVIVPSTHITAYKTQYDYSEIKNIKAILIYRRRAGDIAGLSVYTPDGTCVSIINEMDGVYSIYFSDSIITIEHTSNSNGRPIVYALC